MDTVYLFLKFLHKGKFASRFRLTFLDFPHRSLYCCLKKKNTYKMNMRWCNFKCFSKNYASIQSTNNIVIFIHFVTFGNIYIVASSIQRYFRPMIKTSLKNLTLTEPTKEKRKGRKQWWSYLYIFGNRLPYIYNEEKKLASIAA